MAAFVEPFYRVPAREVLGKPLGSATTQATPTPGSTRTSERNGRFQPSFLPAASPELNPMERVWTLPRRRYLHDLYFPTIDPIVEAVESTFDEGRTPNETLRRSGAIN